MLSRTGGECLLIVQEHHGVRPPCPLHKPQRIQINTNHKQCPCLYTLSNYETYMNNYNLSAFQSYHLVFVDESGCDKRIGFRRTGWSPLGVAPVQVAKFRRDRRYQILPAYSLDGILLSRIFQGTTDSTLYEDFIKQLLQHC